MVILNGMQDLSSHPSVTNVRGVRHIVRSALQNRTTTSWTIRQETIMFVALSVSTHTAQRDNASRFLTFLDTQGIRLLPWTTRSEDLSLIENIWFWVIERQSLHPFPANSFVNEVLHRLEVTWNELLVSVIRVQFDSTQSRVRAVLAARGGKSFY
ncbi:hypothetical protein TNCV_1075781 [Trichonephila clavipes]|uniref:Uncharacterized protein n=1 Tax=Trichonephila clavipes TaxID=2585209 RepID=A0A8X6VQI7_TRICX|nr:hypothetical protein TNCV_1075781 [Trichonephila clavipes]